MWRGGGGGTVCMPEEGGFTLDRANARSSARGTKHRESTPSIRKRREQRSKRATYLTNRRTVIRIAEAFQLSSVCERIMQRVPRSSARDRFSSLLPVPLSSISSVSFFPSFFSLFLSFLRFLDRRILFVSCSPNGKPRREHRRCRRLEDIPVPDDSLSMTEPIRGPVSRHRRLLRSNDQGRKKRGCRDKRLVAARAHVDRREYNAADVFRD